MRNPFRKPHEANDALYLKCKTLNFKPNYVAEVGVFSPQWSNVLGFINDGVRTTLVEPMPDFVKDIKQHFKGHKNVTLYPVAVTEKSGPVTLINHESSTFVKSLSASPALINEKLKPTSADEIVVEGKSFDEIDDGKIDLLSVDTEGSEWFVLMNVTSLPAVISLETHGRAYTNPYLPQITEWMDKKGYTKWYTDKTDTVWRNLEKFHTLCK
jgi:FkbM family methyltransferase